MQEIKQTIYHTQTPINYILQEINNTKISKDNNNSLIKKLTKTNCFKPIISLCCNVRKVQLKIKESEKYWFSNSASRPGIEE